MYDSGTSIFFGILLLIVFIFVMSGGSESQLPKAPLSPETELKLQINEIRKNDDEIRRSKGLPPRDKEYYDNLYKAVKNM